MRRIFTSAIALFLLLGSCASPAQAAPTLFGDFVWGTPKSELEKRPDAKPGQDAFAGDLFLPETDFAGESWNVRLEFAGERLVRVSLMAHYSRERMDKVTRQLRADGFEMLSVLRDSAMIDMVRILKTLGPDAVKEEWNRFMQGESPQRMTYAWFATASLSKDIKTMVSNLKDLLMSAPMETREAEVTLLGDQATGKPGMLLVDFSFPMLRQE